MWRPCQYRRLALLGLLLSAGWVALLLRSHHLMVRRHAELTAKGRVLTDLYEPLAPWRGDLLARDGTVLATTLPRKTIYVDTLQCNDRYNEVIQVLTRLLGMDQREVRSRVQQGLLAAGRRRPDEPPSGAVVIRRHVSIPEWQAITNSLARETFGFDPARLTRRGRERLDELRRRLLFAEEDQERVHPLGRLACHALGYTTAAVEPALLRGASGLELTMESVLAGIPGFRWSERGAAGRELPQRRRVLQPPRDGGRVMLTLDVRLQALAEAALEELASRSRPAHASILIVRPATGEILALAGWPTFEPDAPGDSPPENWINWLIWAPFEPGSTYKVFTLAAAIEDELVTLDDVVDGHRGRFAWQRMTFTDHGLSFASLSLREAFARSLNTVHAQLAVRLGRERLLQYAATFGFAERTGIALPAERVGELDSLRDRTKAGHVYAAIGQGISVTQIQLTMAFCAVVNGGVLMKPLLVGRIEDAGGRVYWHARPVAVRRVLRAETSARMREALLGAVTLPGATGRRAATPDYLAGGKTGTAQVAGTNRVGYLPGRYVASFVGALPIQNPELVVSVVVDEPEGEHAGGSVAAPVFAQVAGNAARTLGVRADATALLTSARP